MVSLASKTSAFHSSAVREPMAMLASPGALREDSTEAYGVDIGSRMSPLSSRSRLYSVTTRLQYRDEVHEGTTSMDFSSPAASKWWSSIFPSQPVDESNNEQDNVDDYLEFLDRRYNRLHRNEETAKPFSAMNWLLQGPSPNRNDVVATHQQQEDALYVLGVAGLASEKLLQKHYRPSHETTENKKEPTVREVSKWLDTMSVVDAEVESDTPSTLFIKKFVVPMVRTFYIIQRRKELFLGRQTQRAKSGLATVARSAAKSLIHGPVATSKAVLEIGGGKKNIALTLTVASTVFLLLRPVFKAAVAEGSVRP
jgi:hypothetical protein